MSIGVCGKIRSDTTETLEKACKDPFYFFFYMKNKTKGNKKYKKLIKS